MPIDKNLVNFFNPTCPLLFVEVDLQILNHLRELRITGILSPVCILVIFLVIGVLIGTDTYIANSIAEIEECLIVQTSMFSILGSNIHNIKHALRIRLEEISTSLDNLID